METNNKLREALTKILNLTNSLDEDCAVDPVEIRDIAKAALADPIRNCEVGTAKEQTERFGEFCRRDYVGGECPTDCPLSCPLSSLKYLETECPLVWAQMPYKEGGDK